MEIINKEQLANNRAEEIGYFTELGNQCIKNDYLAGFNEAESIYLKQIEEKNKTINRIQERRKEMQEEAERLKQQLQEAKELLKSAARASRNRGGNDFPIYEEFLNRNT